MPTIIDGLFSRDGVLNPLNWWHLEGVKNDRTTVVRTTGQQKL
jgi:hypothetical protein